MSQIEDDSNDGLVDIEATCSQRGEPFIITASEQRFYQNLNYALPKRCKKCRDENREKFNAKQAIS